MGNPGVESDPSFWEKRGLRLWGWINSAHEISGTLVFGRRSELCSLISCCNEADASSKVPRSLLLPASGGQRSVAPQPPTPFQDQSVPLQITGALPRAHQTGKFCKSVNAGAHVGVWEPQGFRSRLPGEPSKLATRFAHPEINGPSLQLPAQCFIQLDKRMLRTWSPGQFTSCRRSLLRWVWGVPGFTVDKAREGKEAGASGRESLRPQ